MCKKKVVADLKSILLLLHKDVQVNYREKLVNIDIFIHSFFL